MRNESEHVVRECEAVAAEEVCQVGIRSRNKSTKSTKGIGKIRCVESGEKCGIFDKISQPVRLSWEDVRLFSNEEGQRVEIEFEAIKKGEIGRTT